MVSPSRTETTGLEKSAEKAWGEQRRIPRIQLIEVVHSENRAVHVCCSHRMERRYPCLPASSTLLRQIALSLNCICA